MAPLTIFKSSFNAKLGSHQFASTSAPALRQRQRPVAARSVIERLGNSSNEYLVDGSWVVAPKRAVRGVCHFLGGAFAGASPQLAYPLLCQLLSNAGYTVISTPYAVTFQHDSCARDVHQRFLECLDRLRGSELSWMAPDDTPLVGVGHSNGALLHLLIGALCQPANAANVIISFNNKQVIDAVPVPLDPIRPAVNALRSDPGLADAAASAEQLLRGAVGPLLSAGLLGEWQLDAARPALNQLGSVFGEVGDGADDFSPPPSEVRTLISGGYRVPATLLVQFEVDTIDQTPEMAALLAAADPSLGVANIMLPGSHVTPCGADFPLPSSSPLAALGPLPGLLGLPASTLASALRGASQADVRRLASRVAMWLDQQLPAVQ